MQDLSKQAPDGDDSVNPFQDDIYSAHSQLPGTPQIHQKELTQCLNAVNRLVGLATREIRARGELIFLSSPLAGYGKSHLIGRISKEMNHRVKPLELSFANRVSWREMLQSTLQKLDLPPDDANHDTAPLNEVAAYFLSNFIRAAIDHGIIREKDCPVPMPTLQDHYRAVFAPGARPKLQAWLKKKLPVMRPSVTLASEQQAGFPRESTAFWAEFFLKHLEKEESSFENLKNLSESEAKDRFLHLLHIASHCHPWLIIADHLDACHGSPTAGMEIATALAAIAENVPSVLILSVNDDLWQSVFQDRLPSALLDRLNRERIELAPIDLEEARELLVDRLCASGLARPQSRKFALTVAEDFEWTSKDRLYPRQILRHAKDVWNKRHREFGAAPAPVEPVVENQASEPSLHRTHPPEGNVFFAADRSQPIQPQPQPVSTAAIFQENNRVNPFIDGADTPSRNGSPFDMEHQQAQTHSPNQQAASPEVVDPVAKYFDQLEKFYGKRANQLVIHFPALETLIKTVGQKHEPFKQSVCAIPGGADHCLLWDLPNYRVWIGFQPASNVPYYVNILQNLLKKSDGVPGKIVGFHTSSYPFERDLFTINGIDSKELDQYFDFLQLSNYDLVQIHSAIQLLKETTEKGYGDAALKFTLRKLNPLWQRFTQPLERVPLV